MALKREIGLWQGTALNIIDMVGIGPFVTLPLILAAMGGGRAIGAWILGAVLAIADGLGTAARSAERASLLRLPERGLRPRALGPARVVPVPLPDHLLGPALDGLGGDRLLALSPLRLSGDSGQVGSARGVAVVRRRHASSHAPDRRDREVLGRP